MEKIKDIKTPQSPSKISTEWIKTMLPKNISGNIASSGADDEFSHGGHLGKIEK